ncbi:hypothetical protein N431DRAFT_142233 [Stipitochalara longipes BDJ]|nr:hypothetical protein N431DRAFT_142233 [Stipitochalara longipes BDJ]
MMSSTCLVPFHGVLRLAYFNYIHPPLPHTPGLDTRWIPHSLIPTTWASVHIYKYRRNQERNDDNWNDDEFISSPQPPPALQYFLRIPPKNTFGTHFLTNTHDERLLPKTNPSIMVRDDNRRKTNDNRYPIQRLGNHHDLRYAYARMTSPLLTSAHPYTTAFSPRPFNLSRLIQGLPFPCPDLFDMWFDASVVYEK